MDQSAIEQVSRFPNFLEGQEPLQHQIAVSEILQSTKALVGDKSLIVAVFRISGIEIDDELNFVTFLKNPEHCTRELANNLALLPMTKGSAQRILQKSGLQFDLMSR